MEKGGVVKEWLDRPLASFECVTEFENARVTHRNSCLGPQYFVIGY